MGRIGTGGVRMENNKDNSKNGGERSLCEEHGLDSDHQVMNVLPKELAVPFRVASPLPPQFLTHQRDIGHLLVDGVILAGTQIVLGRSCGKTQSPLLVMKRGSIERDHAIVPGWAELLLVCASERR